VAVLNNTMIKVVQNFSSFFGSIWLTRPLTIHNMVHWSVRHRLYNFRNEK
jgi:hypothetical protein